MLDKILFIAQSNPSLQPLDTLINSGSKIIEGSFYSRVEDYTSVEFALLASFISLCIASALKYFISNPSSLKEWWLFSIELPVDTCLVILTLISTLYIKDHIAWGIL